MKNKKKENPVVGDVADILLNRVSIRDLGIDIREVLIFHMYMYDSVNAAVTRDKISGISGSGNPTIVRVSLADSTRSHNTAVQLWHAYTLRWQTVLVYIVWDV